MKWILDLLTKNDNLPKPVKVFAGFAYILWACATIMVLLAWIYEFIRGTSDVAELVDLIIKLF